MAGVASALPIVFVKIYIDTKRIEWIFLAIFFYAFLIGVYVLLVKDKHVTSLYTITKVMSILVVLLVEILLFREYLDVSWKEIVGILLAIAGIMLL